MLVDDDAGFAALLRALLTVEGVHVDLEVAPSLAAALAAISARQPDCVFLDLGLPDAAGDDTVRRAADAAGATPVIVISGWSEPDLAARTRRAGAVEFIAKADLDGPRLAAVFRHVIETTHPEGEPNIVAEPPGWFSRLPILTAGLAGMLGCLVLAGWALGSTRLMALAPGLPAMKANTAVAFILSAFILSLLHQPTPRRLAVARAAAVIVITFGIAALLETALKTSFGFGEILFDDPVAAAGRPSPLTALAFVLFGVAELTLDSGRPFLRRAHLALGAAFGLAVVAALLGYVYGADSLTGEGGNVGMAVHTVLGLILLLAGGVAQRPRRAPLNRLWSRSPGATLLRRLGPAVLAVPPVLGLLRLAGQDAGWFDTRFGLALFTVSMIAVFLVLIVVVASHVDRDARDKQRAALAVTRSERRYRVLGTVAPVGILETNAEGQCLNANSCWCVLAGLSPSETWGRGWESALHPEDRDRVLDACHGSLAGLGDLELEARFLRPDGSVRWASLRGTAVLDPDGAVTGLLATATDVTELKLAEATARESHAQLQALLDHAPMPMTLRDLDGRFLVINRFAAEMMQTTVEQMLSRPPAELFDPRAAASIEEQERDVRAGLGATSIEMTAAHADGTDRHYVVTKYPVVDADGQVNGVGGISMDITELKQAESRRLEAEERFRLAFDNAPIGMAIMDAEDRYVRVNPAMCAITGYSADELCTKTLHSLTHPGDVAADKVALDSLASGDVPSYRLEKRYLHASGQSVWVSIHATVLDRDEEGHPAHFLAQVQDITERRRLEGDLRHLVDHDPLTGLLNRRGFERELDQHLAREKRYGTPGALLLLDLDHFKAVNDTLGHAVGDELIISIAGLLQRRLRETDAVARLGGDEFAILLLKATSEVAADVAKSIVDEIRNDAAVLSGERVRRVTASVGVATLEGIDAADEALVNADVAMYDAKEAGRDRYAMYATDHYHQPRTKARLSWLQRIRDAIDDDRLVLWAQPILDLTTGDVCQHELLLRMIDEQGDIVPPASFLYVAERYDLIQEIDRWVTRRAIELIESANAHGGDLILEVNLSGKSLGNDQLLHLVEDELTRSRIDPRCLIFEVTETAAVANILVARRFAERLAELGCRFALDDFGAGFGSFYYLKQLPFDFLKIDGEFITHCTTNRTDQLVIDALVTIARGLGVQTIGEVVEDEATQVYLREHGVDLVQGHHLGHPVPIADSLRAQTASS